MSSKGQLQINETILVLIIFTILAIVGLIFFHNFNMNSIKSQYVSNEKIRTFTLLRTFQDLPEIKCSSQIKDVNCVDSIKLFSFKKLSNINFGNKKISMELVYPEETGKECNLERFQWDYPNCNYWLLYEKKPSKFKSKEIITTPVSLFYPLTNEYKIGLLKIESYY
jgi:hypothetical protein